ncbi:hypothetical protein [Paracoccus sp. IB05]|uniref:hypothetical protein n=1 Tax=Paracoccus sp. IB05 TaxID=2779367 RepID=UPI0018E83720|nr:hypothetical protein [Paracoccus sp. IB05]MBJ2152506.1 hypothetical protein [Paracoccus sp. IB05]
MDSIQENLISWNNSLVASIPVAGLLSRNSVAYKWKAPFRCWLLREAAFWRITDLLTQSYALHQQGHCLGARILLRSAFETLATLIYLNHNIRQVVDDKLNFHLFSQETVALALGSRDGSTAYVAVNVLKMLDRGDKRYPGLRSLYESLSESAHPNYEGLVSGYSKPDHDEYATHFSNRWMRRHGEQHLRSIDLCMMSFHAEYDTVWTLLMERLEGWIVANDARLEATKNDLHG